MPGAVRTIIQLRKLGFTVGIVSDSYRVATDIIRRRVFADFSLANIIRFEDGVATTRLSLSPLLAHPAGCQLHSHCKLNSLLHLKERFEIEEEQILAVGDGMNDTCMLRAAGLSVAFEPKSAVVSEAAQFVVRDDLSEILKLVENKGWASPAALAQTAAV